MIPVEFNTNHNFQVIRRAFKVIYHWGAQHSENRYQDHGIQSHHLMANRWGNSGNSVRLYFLGLQNHCRW